MSEFFDRLETMLRERCLKRIKSGNFSLDPVSGEEDEYFEQEANTIMADQVIGAPWLRKECRKLTLEQMATVLVDHAEEDTIDRIWSLAIEALENVLGETGLVGEIQELIAAQWQAESAKGFRL